MKTEVMHRETDQVDTVRDEQQYLPADSMVDMIQTLAMNKDVSIERLQAMIEMKERHEDRQREEQGRLDRRAYFAAMAICQKEVPVVTKTKRNDHNKSNYADLAAIEAQAMPVIHGHGFTVSFQPDGKSDAGELRIKWTVAHSQGHAEQGIAEIPMDGTGMKGSANMTGTQSFGSTASYGRRYLLCMLFNISTGDDNDAQPKPKEPVQHISEEQYRELCDMIEKAGISEDIVCEAEKLKQLAEMPLAMFTRIMGRMRKTIKENTGEDA